MLLGDTKQSRCKLQASRPEDQAWMSWITFTMTWNAKHLQEMKKKDAPFHKIDKTLFSCECASSAGN